VILCASLTVGVASAQQVPRPVAAAIVGRLVDHDSRTPLRGGRIAIEGAHHTFAADSNGRFLDDDLPTGTYVLQAHAIGYVSGSWVLRLEEGQVLTQDFDLRLLPYSLDPVVVQRGLGFEAQWLRDFERRRASGRGYFITKEQIDAVHPHALADLLRNVPGVQMICRGASHCTVRMLRAPRQCTVDYIVDGFPATNSTSPDMGMVGVVAVEVYRTLSETPVQFLRTDNVCGTIVIWTRSGPSESTTH
jgi:hypothetical protein